MHLAAVETAGRALAKGNAYLLLSDDTAGQTCSWPGPALSRGSGGLANLELNLGAFEVGRWLYALARRQNQHQR